MNPIKLFTKLRKKEKDQVVKGKRTCKECGYRIRGKVADHEAGDNHKKGKNK